MRHNKTYKKHATKWQRKMTSQLIVLIVFMLGVALIGYTGQKQAYKEPVKQEMTHRLPVNADKKVLTVADQIRVIARNRGFEWPEYLVKLAYCESKLDPLAIGDSGKSRGLFQIHKGWHPEVSTAQAFDITFATNWTIDMINKGEQHQWSCNDKILAKK